MKLKKTLLFLLILLILVGILYYDKLKISEKSKNVELEKRIIPIPQEDINRIVIKNSEMQAEIKKENNDWKLVKPISTKADNETISSILSTVVNGTRKKTLDNVAEKLDEFGVSDNSDYIEFGSDKTDLPIKLMFGNQTPVPFEVYGRLNNEKSVFVVDESIKNLVNKNLYDLRDKTIIVIVPEDVKTMTLISSAGEIVCEQEEKDKIWKIIKPGEYQGDGTKIEDVIRKINSSKIKKFVDSEEELKELPEVKSMEIDLSKYGLGKPLTTVELVKKDDSQHKLLLGNVDDKTKNYYAKTGSSNQIFEVEESLVTELSASLTKLRDKTLFDFDVENVDRLVVKSAKGLIDAKKKEEKWLLASLNDKEARDYKIADFLNEIRRLKVEEFTNKKLNEIENSGLDSPSINIQVFTNTSGDEKSKEKKVSSNTLKIGNVSSDSSKVYAKYDKIDEVVLLDKGVLDKFSKSSEDVLDKRILKFEPTNVQKLDIKSKDKEIKIEQRDSKWIVTSEGNKTAQTAKVMDVLWKLKDFEYMAEYDKELSDKFEDYCTVSILESQSKEPLEMNLKVNKENPDEVIAIVKDKKYRVVPTIKTDVSLNADFFFDSK